MDNVNIKQLKCEIRKYNLVSKINSYTEEQLINLLKKIQEYKEQLIDNTYHKFQFKSGLVEVNDEQHKIITADLDQNIRIVACAGSGKTTTIVCRIKYLIDKGINPLNIMLTTFNVDASFSMRNKIIELFGFMPNITIGTIDSIACKFYHKYFKKNYYIGVSEYTTELHTFLQGDEAHLILDNYKYLFFDEFQDINDIQFEIVKRFYQSKSIITVIGDDAQNIYQWRGSNIDFILNFDQYINNVTTYKLVENYRSTPEIIDFANCSIKNNTDQIPKDMKSNKLSINFKPYIKKYKHINHQNNDIIKRILYFVKNGIKLDQIAIISRNNYPLKMIEEAIEKHNINNSQQIDYVALITDANIDTKPKIKENHLTLTTIHKAKGLEWRVVFLIGCNDKFFPSEIDNISIQEERRLFYVAVTRPQQYLFIMFTENSISRFVAEIPSKYYQFEEFYTKYFDYNDSRQIKYDNEVTKLIQLIQDKDMEILRSEGIMPKVNPTTENLYNNYEFNLKIINYYLQADFGEFIDRYISRRLDEIKFKKSDDRCAEVIMSSVGLNPDEWEIYKKYQPNFKININKITENTEKNAFIGIISENTTKKNFIETIEKSDNEIVKDIMYKIKNSSSLNKIDINDTVVFQNNYIPTEFKHKIMNSYNLYKNNNNKSMDILEDIYNISLCGNIMNERRRLIYKNMFHEFTEDYMKMFKDIETYIDRIKNSELITKLLVRSTEYDIVGEIDLIDVTNKKIIDYKCSSSDNCKLEWIIQLLMYVALLKDKIEINIIEIYNPLRGKVFTIDITDWIKDKELLQYIYKLRTLSINRNKNVLTKTNPIIEKLKLNIKESNYNDEDNLFVDFI